MKQKAFRIALFFLLLVVALVFTAAQEAVSVGTNGTPTPWEPVLPATALFTASPTPGWWNELPTAIPFPSTTAVK